MRRVAIAILAVLALAVASASASASTRCPHFVANEGTLTVRVSRISCNRVAAIVVQTDQRTAPPRRFTLAIAEKIKGVQYPEEHWRCATTLTHLVNTTKGINEASNPHSRNAESLGLCCARVCRRSRVDS